MSDTGIEQRPSLRIEELLVPAAFPHAVRGLRLVETHISWVILTGSLAYKIKKPVKLDFIDTSTLQRRQHYCEEELRLNRRLAPELYLRVVPISRRSDGQACIDGAGPAIEYAVCMKQFSPDLQLSALLERGEVSVQEMAELGATLARFHLESPELPGEQAAQATQNTHEMVFANLAQLLTYTEPHGRNTELRHLWEWTRAGISAHQATFEIRAAANCIRDCHGDLHARNIVRFEQRLVPFDCIDFDPQLRRIDVMNDIAFLVMDLHSCRREDLAAVLLTRYLEITGDYPGVRLIPFYGVYRALVRAKVDAITVAQSPHLAAEYTERMQRRVRTALALTQRPTPTLLLMHGLSGSGKSWLSEQLVAPLRALRIRSDVERRRLLGASARAAGFKQGNYTPEMNRRVYARLVDCAESCLQAGFNVIVDAAFLDAADRDLFTRLADRMDVNCAFISCHADTDTLLNRVAARSRAGKDASEADRAVLEAQLRRFEPLQDARHRPVIRVDTGAADAVDKAIEAARALLAS